MTKIEAIQAMGEGKKVCHRFFGSDEWLTMTSGGLYVFEDGCEINEGLFWLYRIDAKWNDGWSVFGEDN